MGKWLSWLMSMIVCLLMRMKIEIFMGKLQNFYVISILK